MRDRIHVRKHHGDWAATCEAHGYTHWARSQARAFSLAEHHYATKHAKSFLPADRLRAASPSDSTRAAGRN